MKLLKNSQGKPSRCDDLIVLGMVVPSQGTTTLKTSLMLLSDAQGHFYGGRNGFSPNFLSITRDVVSEDTGIGNTSYRVFLSFPLLDNSSILSQVGILQKQILR